jgi:tetratricopeptide (TPR) repeat protein
MLKLCNSTGLALKQSGQLEAAIVACKRAIEIDPNNSMAYFNLGNTYQDLKQYDLAIQSFEEVLQMDSMHVDALFNLAVSYQDRAASALTPVKKREDLVSASKCYEEVHASRPDILEAKKALDSLKKVLWTL